MSIIKKHKSTILKKNQEPIGTRIAKAVFEAKKISERIFGYISYDVKFVKATYSGKTQRPAKITSIEKGIVGILLVDETSSFEKIGMILGLDVVNDKAEQSILRSSIEILRGFNAIEGDDSCLALTDIGRAYADNGERPDTYTKSFDIYVDKNHSTWYNIKNCIGDNISKIQEINTPCDKLELTLDDIRKYAEYQAQDVHCPQNRYILESATWSDGHEASYKVYVCFVQSIASSEDVRAFVYDENIAGLNPLMADQINSNKDLMSELLENCIKLECEIDEETIILEGDDIEKAKSLISEDIKEAEKQLVKEDEENSSPSTTPELAITDEVAETESEVERKVSDKDRLHKKALYDSLSFEIELQKIFNEDDPDEIWLISPWIRKGAFMHDRGPLIEAFLKDEDKRVFIAYSEPALNNDGKPMMDEEVEPGIKQLDEQYPNFFYVQLPEFHLKNVIEVKGDQKVLFSGSFNVLSFSVSEQQKHVRREEMTLAHHTVAKKKYADFQLEFAEIYANRIIKEIENLNSEDLSHYKNERLDYFLRIDNPDVHKLFSPIEDLIEEKTLDSLKAELYKKLTKVGQELTAASNMGGLTPRDKKKFQAMLEGVSKELSNNAIDDPSTIELLENNLKLLEAIPDKKIFPGKTERPSNPSYLSKRAKKEPDTSTPERVSMSEIKAIVSDAMEGNQHGSRITAKSVSIAKKMCSTTNLSLKNADQLFKVLASTNVLAVSVKYGIEGHPKLEEVHNSLRQVIEKCDDFSSLSIIYNDAQKRIIFDLDGIQFQYEKFDITEELHEIIRTHDNHVNKWNGSRTFMFSSEILSIALKYEIE